MTAASTVITDIHFVDRQVWTRTGNELPQCVGLFDDFCDRVPTAGLQAVRLLGTSYNAALLARLYEAKQRGHLRQILVGTPLACRTRAERRSPHAALYAMADLQLAPSLGGYHPMTQLDYQTYALAAAWRQYGYRDRTRLLLENHPVFAKLRFIPTLRAAPAASVISEICDPRWFVDTRKPDKPNKLHSFLGLNPKTQQGVTRGGKPWGPHRLCEAVRACWYDEAALSLVSTDSLPVIGSDTPGQRPGDFLLRNWAVCRQRSDVTADLRTSQRFIEYLRLVWLDVIYSGRLLAEQGASLFRPADFFKYRIECDAYLRHR